LVYHYHNRGLSTNPQQGPWRNPEVFLLPIYLYLFHNKDFHKFITVNELCIPSNLPIMKKVLSLLLTFFFSSCATVNELKELKVIFPSETLYGIDFAPFTKKGFLITPEEYNGPYESIGMIYFTAKPGAQYLKTDTKLNPYWSENSPYEPKFIEVYEWKVDSIAFEQVLTKVYTICVGMGADALVNFKNEIANDTHTGIKNPVTITGYRITGFAIKRKEH
jgi:hypothetical protein